MSNETHAPAMPVARMGAITPILKVTDLDASLAYWVDVLGFAIGWRDDGIVGLRRGDAPVLLSRDGQGHVGTWLWIAVSDADALHDELRAKGARIRVPPTNYPWGSRELHVFDPDGHVLRFGSDLRKGEPMGPWLDEDGVRWLPQAEGGWKRADSGTP